MFYRMTLVAAIVLVFAGSMIARKRIDERRRVEAAPAWQCRQIVSMAPSITETLYGLGLGDRVVGVTRECKYPPEVKEVKKENGKWVERFNAITNKIMGRGGKNRFGLPPVMENVSYATIRNAMK